MSLSWAFLAAGCPTTVVSQWKADSKATAALMIEFHRQVSRGHRPAIALREASIKVRNTPRYASPMYWAPFVVVAAEQ